MPTVAPPKGKKKPATAAAASIPSPTVPASAPAPAVPAVTQEIEQPPVEEPDRPILYPVVTAELMTGANALTEDIAKMALGWQAEKEYVSAMMVSQPGTKAEAWEYKDVYMLDDYEGNKIRCYANLDNRPFDETWAKTLAQEILSRNWAGEVTMPELVTSIYGSDKCGPAEVSGQIYQPGDKITLPAGTINGSTIVISRTGQVTSGQHSMVALILAYQMWRADLAKPTKDRKYAHWDDHVDAQGQQTGPVIETIMVMGVSEDPRVVRTTDYVKPRSESDVFYTSPVFQQYREQPAKRKEFSRMAQACVDLFWTRTKAQGYKTHSEVLAIFERHPKLLKCIEHIFGENTERKTDKDGKVKGGRMISNLRISAGQAAALCYIMGCSASDGDAYRNEQPPREKGLDWSRWQQAKDFWALIGSDQGFHPVREALGRLVEGDPEDPDKPGLGGRTAEKFAILAKAWACFVSDGRAFTELDLAEGGALHLHYVLEGEMWSLMEDAADFGGIDVPQEKKSDGPEPKPLSREELQQREQEESERKARETADRIRQMRLQAANPVAPRQPVGPSTAAATAPKPALKGGVG